MLDHKHFGAIADAARGVLQTARAFLDATRFGKGTPRTDAIYSEWEDALHALRRRMADAGCFRVPRLPKRYGSTAAETRANAALRTLVRDVGEYPQAPRTAGALPPMPNEESIAYLADFVADVEAFLPAPQPAPAVTTPAEQRGKELHPDGLVGGCWLWWKNKRYDIPKGTVYRLLAFMWDRDSASYNDIDDKVFESAVVPQTVRSYATKAKAALPSDFPWHLRCDAVARQLTKVFAANGA